MAPKNNGRVTQGSHDRLIFNDAGESVKAFSTDPNTHRLIRVQCTGLLPIRIETTTGKMTCIEVELGNREALAFGLQVLQMAGYEAYARPVNRPQHPQDMADAELIPLRLAHDEYARSQRKVVPSVPASRERFCRIHGRALDKDGNCPACEDTAMKRAVTTDQHRPDGSAYKKHETLDMSLPVAMPRPGSGTGNGL